MVRTLSERFRTHEQRRVRLAEAEAKLKLAERKQRTRRLIEAGALAEKACLLALDISTLYGAFLSLRDSASNPKQVEHWAALGNRALAHDARVHNKSSEPLILVFDQPLARDVTAPLRKAGFRYSPIMRHWEGLARLEEAEALAATYGGRVQRVHRSNGAIPELTQGLESVS